MGRLLNLWFINYHKELEALNRLIDDRRLVCLLPQVLIMAALMLEFGRIVVLSYQTVRGDYSWPWHDFFLTSVNVDNTFSFFTYLCFSMLPLYAVYYSYLLHFVVPNARLIQPLRQAVLESNQIILEQIKPPKTGRSVFANIWLIALNHSKAPRIQFVENMSCWPYLSYKIRIQVFRIFVFLEVLLNVAYFASALFYFIGFNFFYIFIIHSNPAFEWWDRVMLVADLVSTHYLSHQLLRYVMVMLSNSVFVIYLYSSYLRILNQMLATVASSMRTNAMVRGFMLFEREHCRSIVYILYSNRILWKKVALAAFVCNLPVNVYFVSFLFKKEIRLNSVIISIDVFLQFLLLTVAFIPVGNLCVRVHRSKDCLVKLQQKLSRDPSSTRWKLRVMRTHEVINSNYKIGISIGDLAVVTNPALFQFVFVYFVYLTQMLNFITYV